MIWLKLPNEYPAITVMNCPTLITLPTGPIMLNEVMDMCPPGAANRQSSLVTLFEKLI